MYIDDAVTAISKFEGRIHWMYLDALGNVTAGVGQLLADAASAAKHPFRLPTSELAPADAIVADYAFVKSMKAGLVASAYRRFGSLLLDDAAINLMLRTRLYTGIDELAVTFPGFTTYPDAVKVSLLDMQFNLGTPRLKAEFPKFCRCVMLRQWETAAGQCHRARVDDARNNWMRAQLSQCLVA